MAIAQIPNKPAEQEVRHKPGLQQVTTVEPKRKRAPIKMSSIFQVDDIHTVEEFVINDMVIPNIRQGVFNIITGALNMIFWGTAKPGPGNTTIPRVSYNTQQTNYNRVGYQPQMQTSSPTKVTQQPVRIAGCSCIDDVDLGSRGDAELVVSQIVDIIEQYGSASILDLCDILRRNSTSTDPLYGWKRGNVDMRSFVIQPIGNGQYHINFPTVTVLN